jgi:amidase
MHLAYGDGMDEFASAIDTAAAIRAKEVSPLEVLDACLARVDAANPELNAVVWRNDEEARAEARALGERIAAGADDLAPFAGVPVPIKDLVPVAGQPNTNGSYGTADGPMGESELAPQAYVDAGFILCGRTNTPEFGSISVTENLRFGATRNPWDPGFTPGGSSGGAGAAVASGMFPAAYASDGGGSIRIPASCCGLVGHKPSRGRVPDLYPHWAGMSTEGVVTRTVADSAAILDALSRPDPMAWWSPPPKERPFLDEVGADPGRLTVAVNTVSAMGVEVAPAPLAAVEDAVVLLESLGHRVVRLEADLFDPAGLADFLNLMNSGMAGYPDLDPDRIEPHNRAALEAARALDSLAYAHSLAALQLQSRAIVSRFGCEFDLLLTPTMAIEPPPVGLLAEVHAQPDFPPLEIIAMAAFTALFNITGQPAVSLPLHVAPSGLPVGIQLVAGPWQDAELVRVAAQIEAAAPWIDRYPFAS